MSIINKRYYWGRKKYNTKTGRYKGEKTYHTDGKTTDWLGRTLPPYTGPKKEGNL